MHVRSAERGPMEVLPGYCHEFSQFRLVEAHLIPVKSSAWLKPINPSQIFCTGAMACLVEAHQLQ